MRKYDTVIWDLDGTLLDTLEDLMDSVNYTLAQYGYPLKTLDEIRSFVGNGVRVLMDLSLPGGLSNPDFLDAYQTFLDYYSKHSMDKTKPYDGVVEAIDALSAMGFKQAIVSNKTNDGVQRLNEEFFKVNVAKGVRDGFRRKPEPDMVLDAIAELRSNPKRTVYVGDSEVDIATARNAGIPCISVLWGFRTKEELEKHLPGRFVSTPEELIKFLSIEY